MPTPWKNSPARLKLLHEMLTNSSRRILVAEEFTDADGSHGTVASSIVTDIKPGMEEEFFAWEYKIQTAQAKFTGYRGVYLQPPPPGFPCRWSTLLRFDSPEHLENWFDSDERRQLIAEQAELVRRTKVQRVFSSRVSAISMPVRPWPGSHPANWCRTHAAPQVVLERPAVQDVAHADEIGAGNPLLDQPGNGGLAVVGVTVVEGDVHGLAIVHAAAESPLGFFQRDQFEIPPQPVHLVEKVAIGHCTRRGLAIGDAVVIQHGYRHPPPGGQPAIDPPAPAGCPGSRHTTATTLRVSWQGNLVPRINVSGTGRLPLRTGTQSVPDTYDSSP